MYNIIQVLIKPVSFFIFYIIQKLLFCSDCLLYKTLIKKYKKSIKLYMYIPLHIRTGLNRIKTSLHKPVLIQTGSVLIGTRLDRPCTDSF